MSPISHIFFGSEYGDGRQAYLDVLRVVMTVLVICVHTVSLAASEVAEYSATYMALEIFEFAFLVCNPMFFMISGALLLPADRKREGLAKFYGRRFLRVVVPLVAFFCLYICAKEGFGIFRPSYWWTMFRRIIYGAPDEAPHFWVVYTLIPLYILTPVFRWFIRHISDQVFTGLVIVIFIVNTINTYSPLFGGPYGGSWPLSVIMDSFAGAYIFGCFLSEKCGKKLTRFILICGALSFAYTVWVILRVDNYWDYIYQNAPTMLLYAGAVFLLIKECGAKMRAKMRRVPYAVRFLNRYSFSILLIHWGVLHYVVKQVLGVDVLSGHIVGGCALMVVLTLAISAVAAFVIDNTIIALAQFVLRKIGAGVAWICGRARGAICREI